LTAKKFYDKSESLCEDALEVLQELLHYDSTLRVWFDRDISFEVGGDLSPDIVFLPSLVTSRSHEKLNNDSRLTSKQSVKLAAVERAMQNIGRDAAPAYYFGNRFVFVLQSLLHRIMPSFACGNLFVFVKKP